VSWRQLGLQIEGRHPVEVLYSRLVGAAIGAPIAIVLAVRLVVGHWPSYGNPDRSTVSVLLILDIAVFIVLATTFFSPTLLLFLLPWLAETSSDGSRARRSRFSPV
jgi:hypothetical protein